jgi:hypothetical protein
MMFRSKQNGLLVIYRIYLKSFMIFSGLYMCCFGFTKLLGTQTSSKFLVTCRAYVVGLHAHMDTRPGDVAPHVCLAGPARTRQFRPYARGKQSPSSTALSLSPSNSSFFSPARTFCPSGAWPPATSDADRAVQGQLIRVGSSFSSPWFLSSP